MRLGLSDRGNTVGKASRDRTKTRESFRETWFEAGRAARDMRLRIGEIRRKILSGGEKVGSKGNLEEAFRRFFQVRRSQATNRGFRIAEAPVWRAGSRPESSSGVSSADPRVASRKAFVVWGVCAEVSERVKLFANDAAHVKPGRWFACF